MQKGLGTKQRRKKRRRAILLSDHDGKIQFVDPTARRWLKEFFGRRKSKTLPRKVYRWLSDRKDTKSAVSLVAKKGNTQLHLRRHDSFTEYSTVLLLELIKGKSEERSRRLHKLTRREREVLSWIARGKSNPEIAAILGISAATVSKHLERIYPKLGVENRTAAASFVPRDRL